MSDQRDETAISQRYTMHEAALLLGLSVDTVRKRAERGRLNQEKAADGTVCVRLDADRMSTSQGATSEETATSPTELMDGLWSYIESLKSELATRNEELRRREEKHRKENRRKDHMLAAVSEGAPELETPSSELRNACEGHAEPPQGSEPPPSSEAAGGPQRGARRAWWLRLLGG